MEMTGTYDRSLVILSILIAAFASYTALSLANRIVEKYDDRAALMPPSRRTPR